MPCGYIDDGYSLTGYVQESPGIHPAARFTFRPLTAEQRARLFDGWSGLSAGEQVQKSNKTLAEQIQEWNLTDRFGAVVDCRQAATYCKLSPPLHEALLDVVCGMRASDPDPLFAARPDDFADSTPGEGFAQGDPEGNSSAG